MNKWSTYFIALGIVCGYCNFAIAGTDLVANALTQSNSYLKDAGLVQKKYSGIARKIASGKIGIPDSLGGAQLKAAQAQAQAVQDKVNMAQKHIEAAQKAQAKAMAKVADLNEKMTSTLAKAQSTLSEGIAITEQYKNSITDAIDTAKNAPDIAKGLADRAVNSVKDTAMSTVDSVKETVNSVKDQAIGIADDAKSMTGNASETISENDNESSEVEMIETIEEPQEVSSVDIYRKSPIVASQVYEMTTGQQVVAPVAVAPVRQTVTQVVPVYNKADAIRSASVMADNASMAAPEMSMITDLSEVSMPDTAVNVSDVMAAAAVMPSKTQSTEVQRSRLNIEQQLQQYSNRVDNNKMTQAVRNNKRLSAQSLNQIEMPEKIETAKGLRQQFNDQIIQDKAILQEQTNMEKMQKELMAPKAESIHMENIVKENSNDKVL